jgi:hypothetical protein
MIQEGKLHEELVLCYVKQIFDGEILLGTGIDPWDRWPSDMPEYDGKVPEKVSVPSVRPVLQEFYGRRKKREKRFINPDQGVLNL